jgi:voltage-gated potassium channel
MNLRARVHAVLDGGGDESPLSGLARVVQFSLLGLITINVIAAVLGTEAAVYDRAPAVFDTIETVSLWVFSVEYVLRVWACTASPRYASPWRGRLRYALQPLVLIDLLAILPFVVGRSEIDIRTVRVLRLLRVLRTLRVLTHSDAVQALGSALARRRVELGTVIAGLLVMLLLLSSLVYLAERDVVRTPFHSIPATMWWGIATLTTVGYGDMVPVTLWGRLLAGGTAILGIGMFALPTSILGASFIDELQARRSRRARPASAPGFGAGASVCPTCGQPRHAGAPAD